MEVDDLEPSMAFAVERQEPPAIEVRVNFGVFAGREATAAEIDRLAEWLLDEVGEVSIISEERHEMDATVEASVHQVRIEVAAESVPPVGADRDRDRPPRRARGALGSHVRRRSPRRDRGRRRLGSQPPLDGVERPGRLTLGKRVEPVAGKAGQQSTDLELRLPTHQRPVAIREEVEGGGDVGAASVSVEPRVLRWSAVKHFEANRHGRRKRQRRLDLGLPVIGVDHGVSSHGRDR
jgi:hypothetical protein